MGTSGTTGQGQTATITFQARVTANAGYVVKNQARITYNDYGWESYNSGDYTCYSSVSGQTPVSGNEATYVNRFTVLDRTIDGRVWYDTVAEKFGQIDPGEVKVSGLTVGVYANTNTTYTTPINDRFGNPLTTTTNSSGQYSFSAIPAGTYKVVATTPSGYIVTAKTATSDNDAVASGTRAVISGIVLSGATSASFQDIGFTPNRTLNGRVWYDTNADGMIDTAETRVSGLTVGVYANTDTTYTTPVNNIYGTALTTTTNASGIYSFWGVPAGTYKVVVTTPSGYIVTLKTTATDNDAVASGTRAVISGINLSSATSVANMDIGFATNRTINGRVWFDTNADGMIGAIGTTETRISGLTVGVYASTDTTYTTPVSDIYGTALTTTTNASGVYSFWGIPAGTYKVVVTTPSGYIVTEKTATTDNDAVAEGIRAIVSGINLSTATSVANQDFGFTTLRTISGRVWYDDNYERGRIDPGELMAAGLTVGLYHADDTTFATPVNDFYGNPLITTTNENGEYSFSNLWPGVYTVAMTTPEGHVVTFWAPQAYDNKAMPEGTKAVIKFIDVYYCSWDERDIGFTPIHTVSGRVWYDEDGDGMIDAQEAKASGLTVGVYGNDETDYWYTPYGLYMSVGNMQVQAPLVTTTDENGEYSISYIPYGMYKVVVTTPDGYNVTLKTATTDNDAVGEGLRAVIAGIDLTDVISLADQDIGFQNHRAITLSKLVKGTLADPDQEFTFRVYLTGVTGSLPYTGASTVAGVEAPPDGTIANFGTVTLKHGQSIKIENIPMGTAYNIIEINSAGYTVTVTDSNASGTLSDDVKVEFVNTKNEVMPTGVLMDVLPYAIVAALAICVLTVFLILRRRRKQPDGPNAPSNNSGDYRGL